MTTFTLFALLLLIVSYGVWQYHKLLKWKRELQEWQSRKDAFRIEVNATTALYQKWQKDLEHREKVWKEFKQKVEKDLKWNWMI
ncbi:hypothetical protein OPW33_12875 [Vibrio europaeus]|uniref:hypothetical protein n=1 Tax=Vibrio europaeus TaxID=300876 RepID=UPI0023412610|nr:hypothetical protein [Vibrio europaeus]MDC5840216.1 hypothetical protein [Vibrio europaeus]